MVSSADAIARARCSWDDLVSWLKVLGLQRRLPKVVEAATMLESRAESAWWSGAAQIVLFFFVGQCEVAPPCDRGIDCPYPCGRSSYVSMRHHVGRGLAGVRAMRISGFELGVLGNQEAIHSTCPDKQKDTDIDHRSIGIPFLKP